MEAVWVVLILLVVGLLWVAAVVFGRDSRDGKDWSRATKDHDGLFHAGR